MWKVSCIAALSAAFSLSTGAARSESFVLNQNQTGFNLPGVAMPGGFDEVRAADGTTCRSSIASAGPYLDVGAVGNQSGGRFDTGAVYGRVVVPLGRRGGRPDCRRLYELEVQRLEMEVRLLRAGLGQQAEDHGQGPINGGSVTAAAPVPGLAGTKALAKTTPIPKRRQRGGARNAEEANWSDTEFSR